jgi:hypothetical protein
MEIVERNTSIHDAKYLIVPRGFEHAPELIEKRGFSSDPAQKAAQNGIGNVIIRQEGGGCQQTAGEYSGVDTAGGPARNSTAVDTDKLAEMLRMIPADKQAEFLRSLADYLDTNRKPRE